MRNLFVLLLLIVFVGCVQPPKPVDPPSPKPTPVDPQPTPQPIPQPQPKPIDPTPPVPVPVRPMAGEFGISPQVYDLAKAASAPTRVADCQRLAAECRRIAGQKFEPRTNPTSGKAETALTVMSLEMVAAIKALPPGWEDLKTAFSKAIPYLYTAGKIKTTEDMGRLLIECSGAFESAARG